MDEGNSWQAMMADTISSSSSSSPSDADSIPSSGERYDLGKSRRQWSPAKFADRIIQAATTDGDDKALADILNAFPEMPADSATLWLAYMKAVVSAGGSIDNCIMRLFPVVNWQDVLVDDESRRLFPEIDRLLNLPKGTEQGRIGSTGSGCNGILPHTTDRDDGPGATIDSQVGIFGEPGRVISKGPMPLNGSSPHATEMARSLCETLHNRGSLNIVVGKVVVHSINL